MANGASILFGRAERSLARIKLLDRPSSTGHTLQAIEAEFIDLSIAHIQGFKTPALMHAPTSRYENDAFWSARVVARTA